MVDSGESLQKTLIREFAEEVLAVNNIDDMENFVAGDKASLIEFFKKGIPVRINFIRC